MTLSVLAWSVGGSLRPSCHASKRRLRGSDVPRLQQFHMYTCLPSLPIIAVLSLSSSGNFPVRDASSYVDLHPSDQNGSLFGVDAGMNYDLFDKAVGAGANGRQSEEFDAPVHGRSSDDYERQGYEMASLVMQSDEQSRHRSHTWSEDGQSGVRNPGAEVNF